MKHFISIIVLLIPLPFSFIWSSTIIVDINSTGDYTSIQEGIDNSQDGDVILVYPGTYYENIDYSGKNIAVASKYYTTGDESYIKNTIIDGNDNGSCVKVHNGETYVSLIGFTIQHGSGHTLTYVYGGGIYIKQTSGDVDINIFHCVIQDNISQYGGGIYINYPAGLTLKGTTIRGNHASIIGGGIYKGGYVTINFSQQDLCNIYMNYSPMGSDISNNIDDVSVYVDTFTVQEPDKFYVYSRNDSVSMNILHHKIEQINHDIYVSPDGNNANSGLNWSEAFQNIYHALIMVKSDSTHPNTIYIDEGTYSPSTTSEFFALGGKENISIIGAGKELTILDAEQTGILFQLNRISNYLIKNCTLMNGEGNYVGGININYNSSAHFENIILKDNNCDRGVSQFFLYSDCEASLNNVKIISTDEINGVALSSRVNTLLLLNNCKIMDNIVNPDKYNFGAMSCSNNSCPVIINTSIINNYGIISSGIAMLWSFDSMYLINCTIVDNKDCSEGTIRLVDDSHIVLINTIIRNDPVIEIYFHPQYAPNSASVEYCNIEGGIDAIDTNNNGIIYWGEGNIDEDPLFVGGDPFSYELTKYSLCIDAGTPDTTGLHLPATDLAGNPRIFNGRIDIGAYECQDTFGVDIPDTSFIHNLYLFQNTPNPFTNETEILFITADYERVEDYSLSIYNTKGQLVRRFDGSTNNFWIKTKIVWDGTDKYGKQVAPGTYLYKLEYNGHAVVRKMVRLR